VKAPDLWSTVVAGLAGMFLLYLATQTVLNCGTNPTDVYTVPATGFAIGAGVQIAVRLTGVS
jgi:hypothetical protein